MAKFTDRSWVKRLFMLDEEDMSEGALAMRYWNTADLKFTDTTLGGNLCINPLPQPCRFTDPPDQYSMGNVIGTDGMSPYYSEIFDDNNRIIYLRFGTMSFTSLFSFLSTAYSPELASATNKGRVSNILFTIGKVIGYGIQLTHWPIMALGMLGRGINYLAGKPSSAYAYLKPAMPLYTSTAQTIINNLMVNLGLIWRDTDIIKDASGKPTEEGQTIIIEGEERLAGPNDQERLALAKAMPDLFPSLKNEGTGIGGRLTNTGQVDLFAVMNKASRASMERLELLKKIDQSSSGTVVNLKDALKSMYKKSLNSKPGLTLDLMVRDYLGASINAESKDGPNDTADTPSKEEIPAYRSQGGGAGFLKYLESEMKEGGAFLGVRVVSDDSIQESFTNSFKQSQLAEKINSFSSGARDTMYNMAGGNLGDNPIFQAIGTFATSIGDVVKGVVSGLGLGGFMIAGGGGVIDMPKYWESSEVSMPKGNYTVPLRARYANRRAAVGDIFIPLSFLLAAACPRSTGKNSHTSMFYCQVFDKGRLQSRLAAISDMTVSRGGGNMGFTPDGHVMAIDVTFNITPMQETLSMPLNQKFSVMRNFASALFGGVAGGAVDAATQMIEGIFDDETPFTDYMASLAGLGLWEQYYTSQKIKRRIATNFINMKSAYSPARMAAYTADTFPFQMASAFMWYREEK